VVAGSETIFLVLIFLVPLFVAPMLLMTAAFVGLLLAMNPFSLQPRYHSHHLLHHAEDLAAEFASAHAVAVGVWIVDP
jgi:hypothetical protein